MLERKSSINAVFGDREIYRGYRISPFGEGSAWSFKLFPMGIHLPQPARSIFFKVANSKARAMSLAKIEIDWLLIRQSAAKSTVGSSKLSDR